jgi:aminopeptidase
MRDPRLAKLADLLVNYSVGVQAGELVLIRGSTMTEPLAVESARAVLEAGGHPHVRLYPDEIDELKLKLGNDAQLDFVDPLRMGEVEKSDALISFWGGVNTRHLSNCDPARQARLNRARAPIMTTLMRRSALPEGSKGRMRWVGTQYPNQAAAQEAEMSLSEFEDFVFKACLVHRPNPAKAWSDLSVSQQRLADHLGGGKEIRFRHGDGTDIRFAIAGRPWINCDGRHNVPDGEVFTAPIEDSAEGTVQFRFPAVYGGREVQNVRLVFKHGRVSDCSASKGEDYLVKMLDQDSGSRIVGELAIGTNYSVRRHTRNTLFDEKIGGTFHMALGAAYPESGGKNKSALHWDMVCDLRRGGAIELDGKLIGRDGRFQKAGWPRP